MVETEPLFCFHHVNAFELEDGRVIMDCLAMRGGVDFGANFGNLSAEFFQRAPWRTALTRLTLDPNSRRVRNSTNPMPWIDPLGVLLSLHMVWTAFCGALQAVSLDLHAVEVQQNAECLLQLLLATTTPEPQQLTS